MTPGINLIVAKTGLDTTDFLIVGGIHWGERVTYLDWVMCSPMKCMVGYLPMGDVTVA